MERVVKASRQRYRLALPCLSAVLCFSLLIMAFVPALAAGGRLPLCSRVTGERVREDETACSQAAQEMPVAGLPTAVRAETDPEQESRAAGADAAVTGRCARPVPCARVDCLFTPFLNHPYYHKNIIGSSV